jgi:hypothetical protein
MATGGTKCGIDDSYYYNHIAMISWLGLLFMSVFIGCAGIIGTTLIWVKKAVICIKKAKLKAW